MQGLRRSLKAIILLRTNSTAHCLKRYLGLQSKAHRQEAGRASKLGECHQASQNKKHQSSRGPTRLSRNRRKRREHLHPSHGEPRMALVNRRSFKWHSVAQSLGRRGKEIRIPFIERRRRRVGSRPPLHRRQRCTVRPTPPAVNCIQPVSAKLTLVPKNSSDMYSGALTLKDGQSWTNQRSSLNHRIYFTPPCYTLSLKGAGQLQSWIRRLIGPAIEAEHQASVLAVRGWLTPIPFFPDSNLDHRQTRADLNQRWSPCG